MKRLFVVTVLLALGACGADGAPEPRTGVSIGAEARIGVTGSL